MTLLLVPLLSLVALWAFSAVITLDDALEQRRAERSNARMSGPVQGLVFALGAERQASVTFLGADKDTPDPALGEARGRADTAIELFRKQARAETGAAADRDSPRIRLLGEVLRRLDEIGGARASVDRHGMDRVGVVATFSAPVDAVYEFADKQSLTDDGALSQWGTGLVHGNRAMDLVMRESALVAGAGAEGDRLTTAEHRMFVELVAQQRLLWAGQRAMMEPDVYQRTLRGHFTSPGFTAFQEMENAIADGGREKVDARRWNGTVQPLLAAINIGHLENTKLLGAEQDARSDEITLRVALAGGLGLVAVVASILLSLRFGRVLVGELTGLRRSVRELAERRLPEVVERLVRGDKVDVPAEVPAPVSGSTTEVAELADAFASVQRTAIGAAVGQADLRDGVRRIFLNIARRNQSLLHRQLALLDVLESRAEPDDLAELFRLDHLTTRMRRHAESLIILSGAAPGRSWREPVAIADVLRGAVAEVEDYTRVSVLTESGDGLVGTAVTDVIHLMAELLENATTFSPPTTEIRVMAERVGSGFVIEVEDRGLGVRPDVLEQINRRLADPPEFDLVDTDQLGLFVVARLAVRHGVQVSLRRSPYGGTSAIVLLPHDLVVPAAQIGTAGAPADPVYVRAVPVFDTPPAEVVPLYNAAEPPALSPPPNPEGNPWFDEPETPEGVGDSEDAEEPADADDSEDSGDTQDAEDAGDTEDMGTYAGLPRRRRQASLVPQLREDRRAQPATARDSAHGVVVRSPEEARSMMASMQQGWRRGRAAQASEQEQSGEGTR